MRTSGKTSWNRLAGNGKEIDTTPSEICVNVIGRYIGSLNRIR